MIKKRIQILLILIVTVFFSSSLQAEEYRLKPLDVIKISVWGYPEMEKLLTVNPDGYITFPPITEEIKAKDMTIDGLVKLISYQLKKYLEDIPKLEISIVEYRGKKIYILGQVVKPGRYTFPVMPNVLEAITQAGGPLSSASLRAVRILRGDMEKPEVIITNVEKYLQTGDSSILSMLEPGDTVYVPLLGEEGSLVTAEGTTARPKNKINIFGEVRAPGVYSMPDSRPLIEALLLAGGPMPRAELNKVRIITESKGIPSIKTVNLNNFLTFGDLKDNPTINPGDTIVISKYRYEGFLPDPEEPMANVVYILGEVRRPGTYQLFDTATVWHTIQVSGGPTSEASINKVKVVKGVGNTGYPETLVYNIGDYMQTGDFSKLPNLEHGDTVIVPKKTNFWRETVKFFSEVAIIVGVIDLLSNK